MKKLALVILLLANLSPDGTCTDMLSKRTRFASAEKAKELLTSEDEFTNSWSQFDIDSRMKKKNSTKEELLAYIATQVRDWTTAEKKKINALFKSIDKNIAKQGFQIDFPDEIYFIKTTTNEEGNASAYTRANYVVLRDEIISGANGDLKRIIIHELFHILSRNNPEFRKAMYKIIGFELMNTVPYPDILKEYRITNPDASQTDSYITLTKNGEQFEAMMILYSRQDYEDGDFFKYLNAGFLKLKGTDSKGIHYVNDQPVIYTFKEVSNFYEQVGRNTQYIIHPEEIMADNFSFAIINKKRLPDKHVIDRIKTLLKNKA